MTIPFPSSIYALRELVVRGRNMKALMMIVAVMASMGTAMGQDDPLGGVLVHKTRTYQVHCAKRNAQDECLLAKMVTSYGSDYVFAVKDPARFKNVKKAIKRKLKENFTIAALAATAGTIAWAIKSNSGAPLLLLPLAIVGDVVKAPFVGAGFLLHKPVHWLRLVKAKRMIDFAFDSSRIGDKKKIGKRIANAISWTFGRSINKLRTNCTGYGQAGNRSHYYSVKIYTVKGGHLAQLFKDARPASEILEAKVVKSAGLVTITIGENVIKAKKDDLGIYRPVGHLPDLGTTGQKLYCGDFYNL